VPRIEQAWTVSPQEAGRTLAAALRAWLPGRTWSQLRSLIAARQVRVGGDLCQDPARRLKEGTAVELLSRPAPRPPSGETVAIRHVDEYVLVVEKPAGIPTVRHPAERDWPARRRALNPTLDDLVLAQLARRQQGSGRSALPRLHIVHRLDKETSGLVVFARTVAAERGLGQQFKAHSVLRRYLAIVPGRVASQRISSRLVRDRGDGRRGSSPAPGAGKDAVTHVEVVERLKGFTLLSCRLETGRTHQIRIHLAELGHPVCGEKVYDRRPDGTPLPRCAGAPRLALHASELGFTHPASGAALHWTMPMPADLATFLDQLRDPSSPG
jgi:23S rRNA pseudouridine1911/1915/1917 synthase